MRNVNPVRQSTRLWVPILMVLGLVCLRVSPACACTVSTVGVSFGNYNPLNTAATDATGSITISCPLEDVRVEVQMSQGSAGSFFPRQMSNGGFTLDYNLYIDANRKSIWGDGTGKTQTLSKQRINRTSVTWTVYGRIPALQMPTDGMYSDTVSVTVWY